MRKCKHYYPHMTDDAQAEMERAAAKVLAKALADIRWAKASVADRLEQGKRLTAGRRKAAKARKAAKKRGNR